MRPDTSSGSYGSSQTHVSLPGFGCQLGSNTVKHKYEIGAYIDYSGFVFEGIARVEFVIADVWLIRVGFEKFMDRYNSLIQLVDRVMKECECVHTIKCRRGNIVIVVRIYSLIDSA